MSVRDKIILITGASDGIGKTVALEFAKKGAKLILPYVKSIIENITNKGGSLKITLKDVDLDLIKN